MPMEMLTRDPSWLSFPRQAIGILLLLLQLEKTHVSSYKRETDSNGANGLVSAYETGFDCGGACKGDVESGMAHDRHAILGIDTYDAKCEAWPCILQGLGFESCFNRKVEY